MDNKTHVGSSNANPYNPFDDKQYELWKAYSETNFAKHKSNVNSSVYITKVEECDGEYTVDIDDIARVSDERGNYIAVTLKTVTDNRIVNGWRLYFGADEFGKLGRAKRDGKIILAYVKSLGLTTAKFEDLPNLTKYLANNKITARAKFTQSRTSKPDYTYINRSLLSFTEIF